MVKSNVSQTLFLEFLLNAIKYPPPSHALSDLQMKHVANPKRQYCANVVLKVNAKLGGANVYLPPRHMPFVSERPTVCPPVSAADFRSSWERMSTTLRQETLFVHPSAPLSPVWTLVLVATLLLCAHKVLVWKSSPISKP